MWHRGALWPHWCQVYDCHTNNQGLNCGPDFPPDWASWLVLKVDVFHPNLDLEGKICLNILREDWKPVLSISSVIYGLQFLFLDPNPEDPLNKEAAQLFQDNPRQFQTYVQVSAVQMSET
eukprot:1159664-Pelagomonas_calceolata.AAC.1